MFAANVSLPNRQAIPLVPPILAACLRSVPPSLVSATVTRFTRCLLKRHPAVLDRLGEFRRCCFAVVATDIPLCFLIDLRGGGRVALAPADTPADARISGPLAALIGMVQGVWDGDALFFSRDLTVEGDTAAVLALRNAIDATEVDFGAEVAALCGPLNPLAVVALRQAARLTGVPFFRPREGR
ncbi:ubiquinone anaerobic biosynthesis accessory factor UbiT [Elstera cyanobacteriorum]|uniref:ubiquinone anaerobic biosynthesis accessory factor UbiT n=1 Tax=Elstera cyanobacteriorum TaxID=2022747 RepID=UPI003B58F6BB